jgi:transposase
MSYIEGESRKQRTLFPEVLDDYISEDNVVRFLDAYVDELEMEELGFKQAAPKETGRPPYDPRDLLKLYM